MAFSTPNIADLEILKGLSTHIVNILDKESTIAGKQLTDANITALNDLYSNILVDMEAIITPIPSIDAFSPTTANTGDIVTITGTNFTGTVGVNFGGTAASSFTVVNSRTITAVVDSGSTGDITITTPAGVAIISNFTFGSL